MPSWSKPNALLKLKQQQQQKLHRRSSFTLPEFCLQLPLTLTPNLPWEPDNMMPAPPLAPADALGILSAWAPLYEDSKV